MHANLADASELRGVVCGELGEKVAVDHQPHEAREAFNLPKVLGTQELAKRRHLLLGHREEVGAEAHDGVAEHDARGGRRCAVVQRRVLAAKVKVVEEVALGVLTRKLAFGEHELEEGGVVGEGLLDLGVRRLNRLHFRLVKFILQVQLGDEDANLPPLVERGRLQDLGDRLEDGVGEVEVLVARHLHLTSVVGDAPVREILLTLQIVPDGRDHGHDYQWAAAAPLLCSEQRYENKDQREQHTVTCAAATKIHERHHDT